MKVEHNARGMKREVQSMVTGSVFYDKDDDSIFLLTDGWDHQNRTRLVVDVENGMGHHLDWNYMGYPLKVKLVVG